MSTAWADEYLKYSAWSHHEFRNLLCGLPPAAPPEPVTEPVRSRQQIADDFVRDELLREAADRHIKDALFAGELPALSLVDGRTLESIKASLTQQEFDAIRRAVVHEGICSKSYKVPRDAAILWADKRRHLFPHFPFSADNISSSAAAEELDTRERTSLLTIIAALAHHASVDITEPAKAASVIEAWIREMGATLNQRTIVDHLKRIDDALERRR